MTTTSGDMPGDSHGRCAWNRHCALMCARWLNLADTSPDAQPSARNVLVTDDEPIVAEMVAELVSQRLGCRAVIAASGDEACALLDKESFDVVLADMLMPGLSGLEFIEHIHNNYPFTDVIVMTGHADAFPYVQVIKAGACDFITKPCSPDELQAKLSRLFRERDLKASNILSEQKYRSLFEMSMNGMLLVEPQTCRILDVNRAFCALAGRTEEQLKSMTLYNLLDPFEQGRFEQGLKICAQGGQGTLGDMVLQPTGGNELYLDVNVTFINSLAGSLICLAFRDVTEKRQIEQRLAEAAQTDDLTGLSNKRAFSTHLEGVLSRARHEEFPVTLIFIDIDNFKQCNDTQGHQAGDEVLSAFGKLARKSIRKGADQAFRYGGDEFAVLLVNAEATIGIRIADRMRTEFSNMANYNTSLSIGVAQFEQDMHAAALVRAADQALYKAKAAGKNQVVLAS